ncbi:MAG: replication factor C large subunit [Candidatus Nezhaarchaeota archaeon]|nr:replication factor C large subunit [Candidatus Nezhaarchaeota archaeon]MCX8142083.1 replication factor C large subunit [Candidatus Nezhaarchaeota archaeon]MDW8050136.1 replication factor C large subunit [Nitrososphaerota archaeon]
MSVSRHIPWTEKHKPRTVAEIKEIVGEADYIDRFISWLKDWRPGEKAALLYGPPGVGKTLLVEVVAEEFNYELIELNASDTRTESTLKKLVGQPSRTVSLYNVKSKLIFLDEVDGLTGTEDRGGVGAIVELVKESRFPIVMAANDPWDIKLRPLRDVSVMIEFRRLKTYSIIKHLKKICTREGITADEKALKIIAELSEGDMRSAVIDLQAAAQGKRRLTVDDVSWLRSRNRQYQAFDVLRMLFSARRCDDARGVMNSSIIDYETLMLWIDENLPRQYTDPEELAKAYYYLARADIFLGRMSKRQRWELLKYVIDFMTAGVAMAKIKPYKFTKYGFPQKLLLMAKAKQMRALREALCERISAKCHLSKRKASVEMIPFLHVIYEAPGLAKREISKWLELDETMEDFLKKQG